MIMVTVKNLPDSTTSGPFTGVSLHCACCGESWSATRGDYFLLDPDDEMTCTECGEPLTLARKVKYVIEVDPSTGVPARTDADLVTEVRDIIARRAEYGTRVNAFEAIRELLEVRE